MENGSLETQLHGPSHGSPLSQHIRMKIALDIARGLEYLHEHCNPPVIHRDLKLSNILLELDFNAKISDFDLAVTSGNHSKGNLKLSETLGYVAPEYLLHGKLTKKSDVCAFGVVLLELLLGRKPVEKMAPSHRQLIVTWAMPQLTDRSKLPTIIDPIIKNTMDSKHLYQVAAVAAWRDTEDRPRITLRNSKAFSLLRREKKERYDWNVVIDSMGSYMVQVTCAAECRVLFLAPSALFRGACLRICAPTL